jgi:predicted glycoside hydrolase/deacetylase ChbG (UPF0249 family)
LTKKLIVNADDFGRSPGVSRGILHAHQAGIVTSTTVMINLPGVEGQMTEALRCPGLGVGLHLVHTHWRPVLPPELIPDLVDDDGLMLGQHDLWARCQEVSVDQLEAEWTAQVERFVALAGRAPDHLDCHQFAHVYPPFFQVYADLAVRYQLPLRVPFPPETDFSKVIPALAPFLEGFPGDIVRGMIVTNSALLNSRGLDHPDLFICTFFGRERVTLDYLLHVLETLPDGTSELMCHPGYNDGPVATSAYTSEREIELAILTDPAIQEQVEAAGIELATFNALTKPPGH